ncbi:MAG: hypothetical protein JOZ40_08700 [Methylobacteriaceae bacterium]|nr:hypothetical protein [Methylobacteriaceae bacterium]
MELAGSTYLYTLATISVTFVGFSTLMMIFRQTTRRDMTKFDVFFTLSFIQQGFIVIAGCLLPPLLYLYRIPEDTVWRIASAASACPIALFVATFPARRRAALSLGSDGKMPVFAWALLLVRLLAVVYLVLNAALASMEVRSAPYAAAMTAMLFAAGLAYLLALGVQLRDHSSPG